MENFEEVNREDQRLPGEEFGEQKEQAVPEGAFALEEKDALEQEAAPDTQTFSEEPGEAAPAAGFDESVSEPLSGENYEEDPGSESGGFGFTEDGDFPRDDGNTGAFADADQAISYSPVVLEDAASSKRGLRIFCIVLAVVIALSAFCAGGYYLGWVNGRDSLPYNRAAHAVGLEAKPKDTDELTAAQIYEQVNPSIVGITVYNAEGEGSQASGVVYSEDGYIVTNDHIYADVASPEFVIYDSEGNEYTAHYVAGDQISDLAVLKVDDARLTAAEFGDSSQLIFGENVVAIGRSASAKANSIVTKGIVSSTAVRVKTTSSYSASVIQTDSAINPGNSGGALVNMYGQVVGITSSKLAGVEYDAVGYAIPSVTMKRVVDELIEEGKVVSRAKLGISYYAIDSVKARVEGYDSVGLEIADVSADSGLYGKVQAGDLITQVNGIQISNDEVILDIIEQSRAGDVITVTVFSEDGAVNNYSVELKQNVGESSYTTQSVPELPREDEEEGGRAFDFPFGE